MSKGNLYGETDEFGLDNDTESSSNGLASSNDNQNISNGAPGPNSSSSHPSRVVFSVPSSRWEDDGWLRSSPILPCDFVIPRAENAYRVVSQLGLPQHAFVQFHNDILGHNSIGCDAWRKKTQMKENNQFFQYVAKIRECGSLNHELDVLRTACLKDGILPWKLPVLPPTASHKITNVKSLDQKLRQVTLDEYLTWMDDRNAHNEAQRMLPEVAKAIRQTRKDMTEIQKLIEQLSKDYYNTVGLQQVLIFSDGRNEAFLNSENEMRGIDGKKENKYEDEDTDDDMDSSDESSSLLSSHPSKKEKRKNEKSYSQAFSFENFDDVESGLLVSQRPTRSILGMVDTEKLKLFLQVLNVRTFSNVIVRKFNIRKDYLPKQTSGIIVHYPSSAQDPENCQMHRVITRVCNAFDVLIFTPGVDYDIGLQNDDSRLNARVSRLEVQISMKRRVLMENIRKRHLILRDIVAPRINIWYWHVVRDLTIYTQLMHFDSNTTDHHRKTGDANMLHAFGWVVAEKQTSGTLSIHQKQNKNHNIPKKLKSIPYLSISVMSDSAVRRQQSIDRNFKHPTHFSILPDRSKLASQGSLDASLLYSFQLLVNTYGVPCYREINPALFSLITFPFFFGVMFGDIGHGILLLLASFGFMYLSHQRKIRRQILMNEHRKRNGIRTVREAINAQRESEHKVFGQGTISSEDSPERIRDEEDVLDETQGDEMERMMTSSRNVLALMASWSIYCGFIYNEFFSFPIPFFTDPTVNSNQTSSTIPSSVYAFGLAGTWHHAGNGLEFFNSYKMKLSVLLGVSQMVLGVILSFMNDAFFGKMLDIWTVRVPQILLLVCIMGYMCILILIKWCTNWETASRETPARFPPSLIQVMIDMVLNPFKDIPASQQLYRGQSIVQPLLVCIALLSIPTMLLAKPLYLFYQQKQANTARRSKGDYTQLRELTPENEIYLSSMKGGKGLNRSAIDGLDHEHESVLRKRKISKSNLFDTSSSDISTSPESVKSNESDNSLQRKLANEEHHDLSDIALHSAIETIEFVLSTVSNTASYLRLWALSLAHGQLSKVFYTMTIGIALHTNNAIVIAIAFVVFFAVTVGVLCLMDTLECLLHSLRLHWVEFQSKFYEGEGHHFRPFSIRAIVLKVE